ncbi:MAG: hypothetical protein H6607_08595 [Flavobacteriales bacterium]|nr:hypothetical protein [Flavobacteriales bacterium]
MKLRILDNSIRLRLSQKEVEQIGNGQKVLCETQFGNNSLKYLLKTHTDSVEIQSDFEQNCIVISVNEKLAYHWANSDLVGLQTANGQTPFVLIEKDFKCLTERGEDETDLFENPNTTC